MSKFSGSIIDCIAHPLMKLTATAESPSGVTPAKRSGSARKTSWAIGRNTLFAEQIADHIGGGVARAPGEKSGDRLEVVAACQ